MSLKRLSGILTLACRPWSCSPASPAGAQVLVQCPGDLNGDAIPDPFLLNPSGTAAPYNDTEPRLQPQRPVHAPVGQRRVRHHGRRPGPVHLQLQRHDRCQGRRLCRTRMATISGMTSWRPAMLAAAWPAPAHRARRGQGVLPHPLQRRHADPPRPLRPPHRPLPRLPAVIDRSSTACPSRASRSTWGPA